MTIDPVPAADGTVSSQALSPLVGREREATIATSLLARDDVRLLTLTGPGGIGKTRLSLKVAQIVAPRFPTGVCIVPLADIADASLVAGAIARGLHARETMASELRDTLIRALRDAHTLIVLDNMEHVLEAAPLIVDLLRACPHLKFLVTSQALLRVSGEQALPVPPLTLPEPGMDTLVAEVGASAAVQLFVERTRSIVPSFALTGANAPAIAAICRRLDGLPLAIELAAAQGSVLPPAALLARIDARLPLPLSGPRDAPDRLRTMRDAIAWSYALLSEYQQQVFRCVSVFPGGWSLEAAEAVCGGIPAEAGRARDADLLATLAALVDKSLVRQQELNGEARFSMLETIRGFGLELLDEHGERKGVSDAHAGWCLNLAQHSWLAPFRPNGEEELADLEVELPNMRAAMDWLAQEGSTQRLARLVIGVCGLWFTRNSFREGITRLERTLAIVPGHLRQERGQLLVQMGMFLTYQGSAVRAGMLLDEGVAILREVGDPVALALGLIWQGASATGRSDPAQAELVLEEAAGHAGSIHDAGIAAATTARALANLGVAAHESGDLDLARVRHEMALRICREQGYVLGAIRSLRDLGDVARDRGDYAGAVGWYRQSLTELGDRSEGHVLITVFEGIALAAVAWGQAEVAMRLMGPRRHSRTRSAWWRWCPATGSRTSAPWRRAVPPWTRPASRRPGLRDGA